LNIIYGLTVNFLTSSYDNNYEYQEELVNDFNKYAKEQNLDIYINRILLSPSNSTMDLTRIVLLSLLLLSL